MTDTTTSPSGTVDNAPLSFDEGVNAIAGLLDDDPVTEPVKTEVAKAGTPETVTDPGAAAEEISDDDLVLDDADLGNLAPVETEAPPAVTDETEVTLDDGTKISIAQLKRNNLYQRDYSQKTEALAQQRKQFEQEVQQRVSEVEREIAERRNLILDNWQLIVPAKPDMQLLQTDPLAYIEQQALYEQRIGQLNALHQSQQQESQQAQERQQEEYQRRAAEQKAKTLEVLPHLKDATKLKSFYDDVASIGQGLYGVTPDEFKSIDDHRYYRIFHDAIQYQKIRQKAASVQKQVAGKPKLVQQQRQPQQAIQNRDRQGRFEALRQTGSIDAAAKSIEDLID
jgi:Skp family chaperone for outer membrane proteins